MEKGKGNKMAKKKENKGALMYALDAETDPFEYGGDFPEPFAWGLYNTEDDFVHFWGDAETIGKQLIDYIDKNLPDGAIIYAHNGGKFDFHFLVEYLDADIKLINGRIAKATILGGRMELRDSLLIIPVPLKAYVKDDIDYKKMKRGVRDIHKNEIIRYLRTDCVALHELVTKFYNQFGLNLTVAGTALKQLKLTGYEIDGTHDRYDSKFRPFYFGGRVQCFQTGHFQATDEPLEYADINSAYSFGMKHKHWFGADHRESIKLPEGDNGSWFAKIVAKSEGCLPSRCPKEKKLNFTLDDAPREYFASGWEINKGLETGTLDILKVERAFIPMQTMCFSDYIDFWFAEKARCKREGDKAGYIFAKLMQNAAYGKFGQDGRKFEDYKIVPLGEWPERTPEEVERNAPKWELAADTDTGFSLFKRPAPSDKFYNVPTAASITAFVRSYLFDNLLKSDSPIYCDTDSIICRKFNGNVGDELGQWEIEAKVHEVYVVQKKMYAAREWVHSDYGPVNKTKVATKGVRLSFDEIADNFGGDVMHYRDAPAFSLSRETRYTKRKINLGNTCANARPLLR